MFGRPPPSNGRKQSSAGAPLADAALVIPSLDDRAPSSGEVLESDPIMPSDNAVVPPWWFGGWTTL